ncbi:hypothetical protein [Burkholderia sp. AU4i]|uniref:hypothetical protein n=1 Tax=Burkholderia sp. AU4i TaxID=1335308 RepID=UPI0005B3C014|nr:hypothetical protein [Burkholderia sp. AU4i]
MKRKPFIVAIAVVALSRIAGAHTMQASEVVSACQNVKGTDAHEKCLKTYGSMELRSYTVAVEVAGKPFTLNLEDGGSPKSASADGVTVQIMAQHSLHDDALEGLLFVSDEKVSPSEKGWFGPQAPVVVKRDLPLILTTPTGKRATLIVRNIQS